MLISHLPLWHFIWLVLQALSNGISSPPGLSTKLIADLFSCLKVVVWCHFRCAGYLREPGASDKHNVGLTGEQHPATLAAGGQMGYSGLSKIEQMSRFRHLAVSDPFHHLSS